MVERRLFAFFLGLVSGMASRSVGVAAGDGVWVGGRLYVVVDGLVVYSSVGVSIGGPFVSPRGLTRRAGFGGVERRVVVDLRRLPLLQVLLQLARGLLLLLVLVLVVPLVLVVVLSVLVIEIDV
ncbi:unnamed protein product, partial [Ectocarpus sp. 12 AP-2014]